MVERVHPVPLHKEGRQPRLKMRHYIYKWTGTKNCDKVNAKCILLSDVPYVGSKGGIVDVREGMFYHNLFPAGNAVFATNVNLDVYNDIIQERMRLDIEVAAQKKEIIRPEETAKSLTRLRLPIPMNGQNVWTLEPSHVRIALWNVGIEAEDSAITVPDEPVTAPGEVTLSLTINDKFRATFTGEVYSISPDSDRTIPDKFKDFLGNTPLENSLEILSGLETKSAIDADELLKPSGDQDECDKLPDDGDDQKS